jgi:hypothetical protein
MDKSNHPKENVMPHYASQRYFSLHDYFPSFHLLLLRSRAEDDQGARVVDIIFNGVFYVDLHTDLDGLAIEDAAEEEVLRLDQRAGRAERFEANKYFVLISGEQRYYVGAFYYYVQASDLGWNETSLGATFTAPDNYEQTTWVPDQSR